MDYSFFEYIGASFYEISSLLIGDFSLAAFLINTHDLFINSIFVDILQIISLLVTLFLAIAAMRLAAKQKEFNAQAAAQTAVQAEIAGAGPLQEQWHDIMHHIESPREGEWKFAVIEADTIVDSVLKNYFPGDTMGERLMNIDKTKLLSIEGLWEAHKVRNRLAHDPGYFLRHAEALRAVRLFGETLKELGAIE